MSIAVNKRTDPMSILSYLESTDAFKRQDESADTEFYRIDRFVNHLDTRALETVSSIIGRLVIEDRPAILDLMASFDSHVPPGLEASEVAGLGLNRNELERNKRLTRRVIHDLNLDPKLPFEDASFDTVLNTVSVDYLTRPLEVFREVGRVLKPGGLFLVIFSNRWFPPKVVRIWKEATESERVELVEEYFSRAGMFERTSTYLSMGKPRPRNDRYAELGLPSDPVYAVYAEKKGRDPARPHRPRPGRKDEGMIDIDEVNRRKKEIRHTLECPYCGIRMKKWAVPDDPFVEWDVQHMYICFNDACPYLVRGWKNMYDQGNVGVSYRLMYNPERDCTIAVPVYSLNALREGIVD